MGLPFLSPREPYLTQGLNPNPPALQMDSLLAEATRETPTLIYFPLKKKKNSLIPLLGKGCGEDTVGSTLKLSQSRRICQEFIAVDSRSGITDKI